MSMKHALVGLLAAIPLQLAFSSANAAGTLYIGTDAKTFDGILPDGFVAASVDGASVTSQTTISTSYHLNGLAVTGTGNLYAGAPESPVIHEISPTGAILSSITTSLGYNCCGESLVVSGGDIYRAKYDYGLYKIDPATGDTLAFGYQPGIVGVTTVGNQLWISNWNTYSVGTYDLATNTYTKKFSTPNAAGGLAYDPNSGIMWVGMYGGAVVPYNLQGVQQGAGFHPFGYITDTVDGLAFAVPEPTSWALMLVGMCGMGAALRSRRRMVAIKS